MTDPSGAPQRKTYEATITRIVARAPDTRSFFLRLPDGERLSFVPGQFVSCLLPVAGQILTRPYTIASDPEDQRLELCLNLVPGGAGSSHLFRCAVGDGVRFTGPWGTFTLAQAPPAECVFIADGTGIAAIRPMLHRALATGTDHRIRLHYAAPDAAHLLYADEFEAAAREHANFTYAPLVGGDLLDFVQQGYVIDTSERGTHFFICGVGDVVTNLRDRLRHAGYERRAVQYEKW